MRARPQQRWGRGSTSTNPLRPAFIAAVEPARRRAGCGSLRRAQNDERATLPTSPDGRLEALEAPDDFYVYAHDATPTRNAPRHTVNTRNAIVGSRHPSKNADCLIELVRYECVGSARFLGSDATLSAA